MNLQLAGNLALDVTLDALQGAQTDARAELAAQFVAAGSRVFELRREGSALAPLLPNGCHYDSAEFGGNFPAKGAADADVVVMLGVLEHIADVETLFTDLRFCKRDVILSYHATDLCAGPLRDTLGFANAYSFYDLATLFDRYGYRIECTAPIDAMQVLMRLTRADRLKPVTACSVAVLSGAEGHFGDRLGRQMINALLPGEADVHHLSFDRLAEAREAYDLVVLGVGGGLFQPLLGDDVLDVVSRAKASIGIFGTQYRELVPRPAVERLVERLDTWFARNEDDVLMYGRGRGNVMHLGDWLIEQFPLAVPSIDDPLQIVDEIRDMHAPDRAIEVIQKHKAVYSTRLHPFLCALTSAEIAAYSDQPSADMPGVTSGSFRSLLTDIFGRSYPEQEFFMVDRDAVRRYKARVHRNVARVAERIDAVLRNVAVAAT
jgi:hypothetical protein